MRKDENDLKIHCFLGSKKSLKIDAYFMSDVLVLYCHTMRKDNSKISALCEVPAKIEGRVSILALVNFALGGNP
jgi:hypothetical protein